MWFLQGGLVLAFVLVSCEPSAADTVVDAVDKSVTAAPRPTHTDVPPTAPSSNTPTTTSPISNETLQATIIFHNCALITMDDGQPQAQAIAIADDKIMAVGANKDILALATDNTQIVDIQGHALLPGFIDSHSHWIGDRDLGGHASSEMVIDSLVSNGWTSINELFVNQHRLEELLALDRSSRLPVRVNAYLPVNFSDDKFGNWYLEYEPMSYLTPHVRLAGIKMFLDHGWGTEFHWEQEELNNYVWEAHQNGWQIASHTFSQEALDMLMNAFEYSLQLASDDDPRLRIEHAVQVRDDQIVRMSELGAFASIQLLGPPDWPSYEGYLSLMGENTNSMSRWRDFVESDVFTLGSTDWPWMTPEEFRDNPPSPMTAMYHAATRNGYLNIPPEPYQLNQILTVEQSLRLLTINGAYGTFEEDRKGSLTVGKWADIVILSDNPLAVPTQALTEIQVMMTMIGGELAYCAPSAEHVCPLAIENVATTITPIPTGLAATCSFDQSMPKITCNARGTTQGSQLLWESNIWGWDTGPSYEILLEQEYQLVPEVVVTLQECNGVTCQTVEASIDTSILLADSAPTTTISPEPSIGSTTVAAVPTPPTTSVLVSTHGASVRGRGYAQLLDVDDGVAAWLSRDTVIKAISLEDPSDPVVVGEVDSPGNAEDLFRDSNYLYVSGWEGFQILRSDDPLGSPLGTIPDGHWSETIVEKGVAYLAMGDELLIIDVHAPQNPVELSRTTYVGSAPNAMKLNEDILYVSTILGGGLNLIDVSDPTSPELLSLVPFEHNWAGLEVRGSFAYLVHGTEYIINPESDLGFDSVSIMKVIDVSDPLNPSIKAQLNFDTDVRDIVRVEHLVYVFGSFSNELSVVDISSPTSPELLDPPSTDNFQGPAITGAYSNSDYVYLLDSGQGIRVVDLSNPHNPVLVKTLDLPMQLSCIHGSHDMLYVCAEERYFNLADVTDPDNPTLLYSGDAAAGSFPYTSIALDSGYMFFNSVGLQVYDISYPGSPEKVSVQIGVDALAVQDNYLFSIIGEIGLDVYDISDLVNPVHVARLPMNAGDFSLDGDWLVGITNIPYSITLVNISNPRTPSVTDNYEFETKLRSVTTKNGYVYVAHGEGFRGTDIFMINSEGKLVFESNIPGETEWSSSHNVSVASDRAYVVSGGGSIKIFDIADSGQPIKLGELRSRGMSERAIVIDGYIYVADGHFGLTVIKLDTD